MTNRRSFIRWGIIGLVLSRIFTRQSSVKAQTNNQFYEFGTVEELDDKGILLNEDFKIGAVLVMRKEDQSVMAIDPTCTHAGCTVKWKDNKNAFICPCHRSKFQQDGTRISGLATSDLNQYQVKIEENKILVAQK